MELQWNKKSCPYLQTHIHQVQSQEETMELRLPEELPDIGRVLCAWGQSVIRGKQWRGDGMTVSGGVSTAVLYQPEDGSAVRCVEGWLPFQAKWNFPQTRREGAMRVSCMLRGVDARTISARKMMLRANVSLLGEALEPAEAEICVPGELPDGVEVLTNVYPAVIPAEAGEKQFRMEEEIHLPGVSKWVSFTLQPEINEQNVVGSRVVLRGTGHLHYVCLDEAGEIRTGDQQIPFAQFVELDREFDADATTDILLCLSALEPELIEDGVRIQGNLTAQYLVKDRVLLEIAEDAYSPERELSVTTETLKLPMELDSSVRQLETACPCREGQPLDMVFLPEQPLQYREGDMIHLELSGQFCCLYRDAEGNLQSVGEDWNDSLTLPAAENTQIKTYVQSIEPAGSGVRVGLNVQVWTDQNIPMVSALTVGEMRPKDAQRPSLLLRRMDADSLWELAKASGSTVNAIRKANQLTQEPVQGQMLLIPVI